ncbi:uncharacterized protein BYT42DRAFT_581574 [Radiomyces spectabilis]|uniref:uncharacterized protein n=1 Tax=Radiomyces spectabilis TaxID=64574 RepID=UPI002220C18E|nr:uncharacterized protein BYT42DRAFT_581574 [Radiomyces spectabilis]KAI8371791.1 hypothetical protein BYT42DRAFT_581574 [Radiomyces spectabilis]
MSLLLTKTCEYAILVAIQQGRNFSHSAEHDISVQSKLELLLPSSVDDLIPPTTVISTAPAPIARDGTVSFHTTLAYLVSSKLLHRLRANDAHISLNVGKLDLEASRQVMGTMKLQLSTAKMVVQRNGPKRMEQVNEFVVDKGVWHSLSNRKEQIKAGIFIVAMRDKKPALSSIADTKLINRPTKPSSSPTPSVPYVKYRERQSFELKKETEQDNRSTEGEDLASSGLELRSMSALTDSLLLSPSSSGDVPLLFSEPSLHTLLSTPPPSVSFARKFDSARRRTRSSRPQSTTASSFVAQNISFKDLLATDKHRSQSSMTCRQTPPLLRARSAVETEKDILREKRRSIIMPTTDFLAPKRSPDRLRRARSFIESSSDKQSRSGQNLSVQFDSHKSASDIDVDQLSTALNHIRLRSTSTSSPKPQRRQHLSPEPIPSFSRCPPTLTEQSLRYHQIGKGLSTYTFYFNILHTDNPQSFLKRQRTVNGRRGIQGRAFFSYNLLSTHITCPATSLSPNRTPLPACFRLRGHLYDIQQWLDNYAKIDISLVLDNTDVDGDSGTDISNRNSEQVDLSAKEIIGVAKIPLAGVAFDSTLLRDSNHNFFYERKRRLSRILTERRYPVYGTHQEHIATMQRHQISTITVQLGLVSGWWTEEDGREDEDQKRHGEDESQYQGSAASSPRHELPGAKRSNIYRDEPWDWLKKKKSKLYSTTLSSSSSPSFGDRKVPHIHIIDS